MLVSGNLPIAVSRWQSGVKNCAAIAWRSPGRHTVLAEGPTSTSRLIRVVSEVVHRGLQLDSGRLSG